MFKRPLSPIAEEDPDPRPAKRARLEPLQPVEFCVSNQSLEPRATDEPQDAKTQMSQVLQHLKETKYPDLVWFAEFKLKDHTFDFGGELGGHKFAIQVGEVVFDKKLDTLSDICQSCYVHLLRLAHEVKLNDYQLLLSEFVIEMIELEKAKTLIRQIENFFKPSVIAVKSGKYKCQQCSYGTKYKHHLTRHIFSHTGEKPFKCDHPECDKAFVQSDTLTVHMRVHTGERPFKCDYPGCDNAFASSGQRTTHMRIHTGDKPFKCEYPECSQAFTQSSQLTTHKRIHTGEKPFKCDFVGCDQVFRTSGNLTRHMRYHTGERPFKCNFPECDKAFTQSSHLITHMRYHTGERPFKCDFPDCDQAFANCSILATHKRSHSGEKPFRCEYPSCDRAFVTSSDRIVHMRYHTGEKPFKCDFPECDQAFTQSGELKVHKTRWHTERGIQRRKIQEEKIHKFFLKNEVHFDREPRIDFKCAFGQDREKTCAKIDFVFQRDGHIICLEVDEREHSYGYELSCEMRRMSDIYSSLLISHGELKSLTFIRYNPDAFTIDEETQKVPTKKRQAKLLNLIQNYQPVKPFEIIYMYYSAHTVETAQSEEQDEKTTTPAIAANHASQQLLPDIYDMPDFNENMKQFVRYIGA